MGRAGMSSSAASSGSTAPISRRALAASARKSSEMACFESERAGAGSPQHGDVADAVQRTGDVAGERADVGALGHGGQEGGFVAAGGDEAQLVNGHLCGA